MATNVAGRFTLLIKTPNYNSSLTLVRRSVYFLPPHPIVIVNTWDHPYRWLTTPQFVPMVLIPSSSTSHYDVPYEVSNPILGADFLQFYHLIIDIKCNKLIDTVIQGVCTRNSSPSPVLQPIQPSNPFTSLLAEFPSPTHPPSFTQTVCHSTTHTIHTKGLPIWACTRRLAPDRLKVTRHEFDLMLQLGIIRPSSSIGCPLSTWC